MNTVTDLEIELFEEHKQVDKICREMFSSEKGVKTYIEQMEATPYSVLCQVSGWDNDLRMLKRAHWIRNTIAHETAAVDFTEEDVDWLIEFHRRILNCQDPLAIATRISNKPSQRRQQANAVLYVQATSNEPPKYTYADKPRSKASKRILVLIIAILIVAVCVGLFCFLSHSSY